MKLLPNKTFPHPVLWKRADDYVCQEFQAKRQFSVAESNIPIISCQFEVSENSINQLIREGAAVYVVEIHCPLTYVRRVFQTNRELDVFCLQKGELYKRVEVNAFIVCKKSVGGYRSENFNNEFGENASFDLDTGDVLAAAETEIYYWDTEFFKSVHSVIDLVANENINKGQFAVDVSEERIKIQMHPHDKATFESMRKTAKPVAMFVYFSAVAEVLRQMREDDDADKKWYRAIESELSKMNRATSNIDPFMTAQELMRNPLSFLLSWEPGE